MIWIVQNNIQSENIQFVVATKIATYFNDNNKGLEMYRPDLLLNNCVTSGL